MVVVEQEEGEREDGREEDKEEERLRGREAEGERERQRGREREAERQRGREDSVFDLLFSGENSGSNFLDLVMVSGGDCLEWDRSETIFGNFSSRPTQN